MAFKLGLDCKFYLGTSLLSGSVTPASNTWTEQSNVRDLTLSLETGEADVTTRANNGWRAIAATLKEGSIEFEMVWDTGDAGFAAIKNAFFGNEELAVLVLDGDKATPGSDGLASNCMVTSFSRAEPLEEAVTVSVTIKPSSFTTPYTVATP